MKTCAQRVLYLVIGMVALLGASTARADLEITVTPNALTIPPGEVRGFEIRSTILPGFPPTAQTIEYSAVGLPGNVGSIAPVTTTAPAFPPVTALAQVLSSAPPGTYPVTIRAVVRDSGGFQVGDKDFPNALTITVPAPAAQPDFTFSVVPPFVSAAPGQSVPVTLSIARSGGFNGDVNVTASATGGATMNPSFVTFAPGESTKQVTILVPPNDGAATIDVTFTATAPSIPKSLTGTMRISIVDFSFSVSPAAASVTAGNSVNATLNVTRTGGFDGPVDVTVTGLPSGVTVTPSTLTIPAGASSLPITLSAAPGASASTAQLVFTATNASLGRTRNAFMQLTVVGAAAPADFAINAPAALTLLPGETMPLTLSVTRQNLTEPITVSVTASPGLAITPLSTTLTGTETTRTFQVTALPGATGGTITFLATTSALPTATRSASTIVTVPASGNAPTITSIVPQAVVAGSRSIRLLLAGTGFAPGAIVQSSDPAITIESASVQTDTLASVVLSVDGEAEPRSYRLDLQNPDGGRTASGVQLLVYDPSDIGAPLGVTGAAIVSPVAGKIITTADRPYATGIVATSGTGTISGRWLLDGATFDAFTITVQAGEPATVTSRIPIPPSFVGAHALQLVIDRPEYAQSASIGIRMALDSASNLTILESSAASLRWSMVPGAVSYRVEVRRDGETVTAIEADQGAEIALDLTQLSGSDLDAAGLAAMRASRFQWRVAPLFCCSASEPYPGAFTEWHDLDAAALDAAQRDRQLFESIRDRAIRSAITPRLDYQLASLSHPEYQVASVRVPEFSLAQLQQSGSAPAATSKVRRDWLVIPSLTSTYKFDRDDEEGAVQLSGQGDLGYGTSSTKYTTDFTGTNLLDDGFSFRGSRNWIFKFGDPSKSTSPIRPQAIFGYGPPDFFRGAQLVTSSFVRGGGLARAATRLGTLSYYSTFTDALEGVWGGNFGMRQKVDAAAIELPSSRRFNFKILGMRVEEEMTATQRTPASDGESIGFLATWTKSPLLQLVVEGARGEADWATTRGLVNRSGEALRAGISGSRKRFNYRLDLNHTDAGFVNPANRGFSSASIPNRTGGTLTLSNAIGRGTASLTVRHQGQSRASVTTRATGVNLSFNRPLFKASNLSATGNFSSDRGGATGSGLPRTERAQYGATFTLSQSRGRLNFSQTLAHQRLDDEVMTAASNELTTLTVTGGGSIVKNFDLFTSTTWMHTAGSATSGDSDSANISLTPSISIPSMQLSLQPRVTYHYATNDLYDNGNRNESYAAIVQWNPVWFRRAASMQLSSNWNRNTTMTPFFDRTTSDRTYVANFTLKWGEGVGPALFRRNAMPGELPLSAPERASRDAVNGKR